VGYEKITSAGFDREQQSLHTFKTLMQAEYNRLCEERGIDTVDEQVVSAAFNRLMFTPIERMVELESQFAAEASAVEAVQKLIAREGYEIELGAGYASLTKDYSASTVATATGETWKAALAALVQAEGKEAGK